jgi:hypothetical protein
MDTLPKERSTEEKTLGKCYVPPNCKGISRRRDRRRVSIRDDCIRWTKDAQPGRHVDSNQTTIAQHQRRSPAEQCECESV